MNSPGLLPLFDYDLKLGILDFRVWLILFRQLEIVALPVRDSAELCTVKCQLHHEPA